MHNRESQRILIIDDEEAICDACTQVFHDEGYTVETSLEGTTGLRKLVDFKPDVVLIDSKLPGMGGIEVLEKMGRGLKRLCRGYHRVCNNRISGRIDETRSIRLFVQTVSSHTN